MKTIKEERIVYSDKCPICKREIRGTSISQIKYNMEVHVNRKHKGVKE